MATTIITKNGSGAPSSGDLVQGELAVDLTNQTLYSKDSSGNVFKVGDTGGGSPGTFTDLVATDSFTSPGIDDNATTTALTVTDSGIAATLTTAAQPNITSVGTLTGFTSTGIDDNATSTAITIDANENVGIGTPSPDGKLNVFSASAGSVTADVDADELVLENSDNVGLSLLTASTGESGIYFGNPGTGGQKDFFLKYYHEAHATTANRRAFTFNTRSVERMRIDSSGFVTVAGGAAAGTSTTSATGSTTLDFSAQQNFVLTLTGNVTLANPTTETVGQSGFIVMIQDATGGRTVSLGTEYETAGGAGLSLSTAASTTDIVPYVVAASGRILLGAPQLAFA